MGASELPWAPPAELVKGRIIGGSKGRRVEAKRVIIDVNMKRVGRY